MVFGPKGCEDRLTGRAMHVCNVSFGFSVKKLFFLFLICIPFNSIVLIVSVVIAGLTCQSNYILIVHCVSVFENLLVQFD